MQDTELRNKSKSVRFEWRVKIYEVNDSVVMNVVVVL